MEGNMNFFAKAFTVFKGLMETSIGTNHQKGLENIDRILSERLNDYRFELKGSSIIQKQFYLYLTFQKNNLALDSIISKGSNQLYAYANKNNLDVSGSVFSIVPKTTTGAMTWKLGLPIKKPHFAKDTFIKSKVMPERKILKGVHYGSYDNINRSWEKLNTEMELLNPKLLYYPLTIYIVNKKSDKDPLTWETQLLLPYK
jgi:effector-binding domain-containing protein